MAAVTPPGARARTRPARAVPIGDRLGPEGTQGTGRRRRSRPDHSRAREPGELHGEHADPASRTLRADATRNRDQLLEVAARVFVSAGTEPSMRAIAREA